jgi:peptidoglycan/LPS O-acetylase OafA/YrhL
MMSKSKLLGIEFCRGLSTYAVILVHSGDETWELPIADSAITFRLFFYFAVPFFLATAFYFMTAKAGIEKPLKLWRSRLERLVVPYSIWSAIFLFSRVVIFTLENKIERLQQLLQDPPSIIFLGGASYHLYFLPLLLTGTSLIMFIPLLDKLRVGKYSLVFLSVISIFLYCLLKGSGNAFQLGSNVAFESLLDSWQLTSEDLPLLRLILVEFSWIIQCLPYFFVALTLHRFLQSAIILDSVSSKIGWGLAFLFVNSIGTLFLPGALCELLQAYTLLLFSLAVSNHFSGSRAANFSASIGACSFGIYLFHPFAMRIVKFMLGKVFPSTILSISIASMLTLSIPCFLVSWLVVTQLSRNKVMTKYLFSA